MNQPRIELCNLEGRAALHVDGRVVDVERRSAGRFTSDPMAALARWDELCAWGADRAEALDRLRAAVADFVVAGPKCNLPFFAELLADDEFQSGDYDTGLVARLRS